MSGIPVEKLLERIPKGATILVENRAPLGIEAFLVLLLKRAKESGLPVIVEDILDTFPIYAKHLSLLGKEDLVKEIPVLKLGGMEKYGKVIKSVRFDSDPQVYVTRYDIAFREVALQEMFLDIVVGIERLFSIYRDPFPCQYLLSEIKRSSLNPNRTAVYLIDSDVMERVSKAFIPRLEDLATSVLEVKEENKVLKIHIKKDPATLLFGEEKAFVELEEIL
jgi:hypothetical protein